MISNMLGLTMLENRSKCLIWIFGFWHFSPVFVILNLACLVTMSDRNFTFSKTRQIDYFFCSKCNRSSLCSQCWMRLFCIDICHCAYPTKMLTGIFRTLLRYFTSSVHDFIFWWKIAKWWLHVRTILGFYLITCPLQLRGWVRGINPLQKIRDENEMLENSVKMAWPKTNEKKVATCYLATLVKKNVKLESLKWWCSFFYWHFEQF